ncbi:MAG TPA: hypothetical protein PKX07_06145, partial [Aggregatilineales bacterium]|nr:hypothetical protein [Aggregatilineales bacterium]
AERSLDLFVVGLFVDAEYFVVILRCHDLCRCISDRNTGMQGVGLCDLIVCQNRSLMRRPRPILTHQ